MNINAILSILLEHLTDHTEEEIAAIVEDDTQLAAYSIPRTNKHETTLLDLKERLEHTEENGWDHSGTLSFHKTIAPTLLARHNISHTTTGNNAREIYFQAAQKIADLPQDAIQELDASLSDIYRHAGIPETQYYEHMAFAQFLSRTMCRMAEDNVYHYDDLSQALERTVNYNSLRPFFRGARSGAPTKTITKIIATLAENGAQFTAEELQHVSQLLGLDNPDAFQRYAVNADGTVETSTVASSDTLAPIERLHIQLTEELLPIFFKDHQLIKIECEVDKWHTRDEWLVPFAKRTEEPILGINRRTLKQFLDGDYDALKTADLLCMRSALEATRDHLSQESEAPMPKALQDDVLLNIMPEETIRARYDESRKGTPHLIDTIIDVIDRAIEEVR